MKKIKIFFLILIVGIAMFFVGRYSNDIESNIEGLNQSIPKDSVFNDPNDNSVWQVKEYLLENLHDPESYQPIGWGKVTSIDGSLYPEAHGWRKRASSYQVRHKYRAKNGFGAYMVNDETFYLNKRGLVLTQSGK